jgi:hypothetical protein
MIDWAIHTIYFNEGLIEVRSKTLSILKVHSYCCHADSRLKVKVKFTQEQATKAKRGSRGIALLFL